MGHIVVLVVAEPRLLELTVAVHPQPVVLESTAVLRMAICLLVAVVVDLVLELGHPQELVGLMLVVRVELQALAKPPVEETMASTTQSVGLKSVVVEAVVGPVLAAHPARLPLVEPDRMGPLLSDMPVQTETHLSRRLAR